MKAEPFVIERVLNAPVERVWRALTDNEQMKQWYFQLPEFKAEPGFKFTFEGGSEEKTYVHLCEVIEAVPNKKLKHSWRYQDYPGNSFVTWELFPEGTGTRIKLTHEGLETFPADSKDFARESFSAGWTHIVGTSLKEFVEEAS